MTKKGETDDDVIKEAKARFKRCEDWEAVARERYLEDLKFANGDSDNGYQWPTDIYSQRDGGNQPCLTINKVRQHNLQIINDARQNKPGIKINPTGNGATYDAAQVFEGICRHIEYISNAQAAYDTATRFQVQAGIGYWRVVTDYAGPESFDQEIFIRRIKDPLTVYLDPDITEVDGSDARFGFIFTDEPRDKFEKEHPDLAMDLQPGKAPLGDLSSWITDDHVRIAEYYRKVVKEDELIAAVGPTGQQVLARKSEMQPQELALILSLQNVQRRPIKRDVIEWYKIQGDKIIERRVGADEWPGRYIPIIRLIAEETIIDGQLDRKGHTRALKDPQRMYNYWSSSAVEMVALQSKTPYIGPMTAFEGVETYWNSANIDNQAWLPYNDKSDDGREIPRPERQQPPVMATAYLNGMKIASDELMAVSGQFQAELGMPSNEKSGVAIQQRQRQGDNATYHYIDHLGIAIRFTGKILIDLVPKIYDTPRIIRILGEDGTEEEVQLDPQAKQAYEEQQAQQEAEVRSIFNPNVGQYDVQADIGPNYGTKRQETFNAFQQILTQNKEAFPLIGDLMFKAADFPMANEIAERLRRMVPPQALGGENPQMQQLQGELQHMQGLLQTMAQQLAEEKFKQNDKAAQKQIDIYKAITDRLAVIEKHVVSPRLITEMTHDLAMQEHAQNAALMQANQSVMAGMLPMQSPEMMPQQQAP